MGFQGKMIFVKFQDSIVPHSSQFLGQGAAVQIQIIGQLLAVKWNVKGRTSGFQRLAGKINQKPFPDGFRRSTENPAGENQIFLNRDG